MLGQSKSLVYLIVVGVMIIWGLNVTAIKIIVTHFPAITITAVRIFVAFLSISPILFFGKLFRKLTKKELALIVCITVTGVLGHHIFLAVGLSKTMASNAGLILGAVPLTTSIFATVMLRERFTVHRFLGILFGMIGVSMIVLAGSDGGLKLRLGDLYVILSVIAQAISFIFIKMASKTIDVRLITGITLFFGSVLLFSVSLGLEPGGLARLAGGPLYVWIVFFASGVVATGVGHLLYNNAIKYIGPAETSVFLNMTPFFSLVGAYLLLGETFVVTHLIGFIFIVTGVVFGTGVVEQFMHRKAEKGVGG